MTYAETLDYLYQSLPMFSRMGSAAYKKDLTNTRLLCQHLGHPEQKFKSIHIAGTNGKGSVSHMLASILQQCGYKTGLYTSPHLYDFRERIKLNGQLVDEQYVVNFVAQHRDFIEEIQPSFFETTVAMAFQYFAEQRVDVAVIEVGLGGRLDSTNVITPVLSVITNIGWDHTNLLGNTLAGIAAEKAGIIKNGVPVVIGETVAETRCVFEKIAQQRSAPIRFAEENFTALGAELYEHLLVARYQTRSGEVVVQSDLPGLYQAKNIASALTAVDVLSERQWNLPAHRVRQALQHVKQSTGLHGRWEVMATSPMVVLEVAHNKNGIEQMLEHIARLRFDRLHLVLGMVKDKDTGAVLSLLPVSARYYFAQAGVPRALPAAELKEKALACGLTGDAVPDVNDAVRAALQQAGPNDLVVVCGSIFLVAEVDHRRLQKAK